MISSSMFANLSKASEVRRVGVMLAGIPSHFSIKHDFPSCSSRGRCTRHFHLFNCKITQNGRDGSRF